MKITFFVGEFNGGGAERVISILANKMIEKDFDIEILKYHNTINSYETDSRIVINSVEENTNTRTNTIKNLKWMHNHFKKRDIVISFLAPFNILALLANIGNKTPIIVADRNDPRKVPGNPLIRTVRNVLYRFADGIALQTSDNMNYFSKAVQEKSRIIYNPVDLGKDKGSALNTQKEKIIVSTARLEEQKNQKMLIRSFNDVLKEYKYYKLVIYGEGSYRDELQALINELNLNDKVFMPGEQNDIIKKIKSAKLFVLCSNYEGMSNSLIEAMCVGLPVICTKVSGSKELIQDGENGLLINIGNQDELTNAIKQLLSNEELCNKLAKNASSLNEKLDCDAICDEWLEFINSIRK